MNWYCIYLKTAAGNSETVSIQANRVRVVQYDGVPILKFWTRTESTAPGGETVVDEFTCAEFNLLNIMGWKYDRPVDAGE